MEPFTLIIWLYVGIRFEEVRMVDLGRGECVDRKMAIEGDRGSRLIKGQCIGAGGYILPMDRPPPPPCAHVRCGLPAWGRVWAS